MPKMQSTNVNSCISRASLFGPILDAGCTSFRIQNRPWKGDVVVSCSREWGDLNWDRYMHDFCSYSVLDPEVALIGHEETGKLFERAGLAEYLNRVCADVVEHGLELVEGWALAECDVRFLHVAHSSWRGARNRLYPLTIGATRRYDPERDEAEVLREAFRMARAMAFKSAAIRLPFGGSANVVVAPPIGTDDEEVTGFLAYAIDRTRSLSGPELGLTLDLVDVVNSRYSPNLRGSTSGSVGLGGTHTAYSTMQALRIACGRVFGRESVAGLTVGVMGLGSVGRAICELLLAEGAALVVADARDEAVRALLSDYPPARGHSIQSVSPFDIVCWPVDILVPAAVGGVVTEATIPEMKCRILVGSANNALAATDDEDELRLADLLQARGILYQVEWVHNVGGILSAIEGYTSGDTATPDDVRRRIDELVPAATHRNFDEAEKRGVTPSAVAYERAREWLLSV